MNRKCLCALLSLLLALGQPLAVYTEQVQAPETAPVLNGTQQAQHEAETEREILKLPLYDRFIVKLKTSGVMAMSSEGPEESIGASAQAALPAAKSEANAQVRAVLSEQQAEDTEAFDLGTVPSYRIEEQTPDVLTVTLTEKVDAETFMTSLESNAQIEYVQPDYSLELSAVDDTEAEAESGGARTDAAADGAPVPEAAEPAQNTPEPELSPTPEPETEATPEPTPEATPEPTPEATPEPTPQATPEPTQVPATAPIVAVLDSGVDVTHLGLAGRILEGYDFVRNSALSYDSTQKEEYYHGTHVAGTVAQNAPDAQVLPLKVFEGGRAFTSDVIRAIEYAEEHGAQIANMSFGSVQNNRALKEAMQASGMLFVCAAGNYRLDVEKTPIYPACFDLTNIVSVASLNQDLGFSYYSNYGTQSVDIAAIGRDVYSMLPEGQYGAMSGTSVAAAQVSAGAAVQVNLGAQQEDVSNQSGAAEIKAAVLDCADRLAHLANKVAGGRSLNLSNIAAGTVNEAVQSINCQDDFDVHGYQPTPEENWELFSSLENVQVAADNDVSFVLKSDGSVWSWGGNGYNMLGDKSPIIQTPHRVIGLHNIVQIALSADNGVALTADGRVYGWGYNEFGTAGNGAGDGGLHRPAMPLTGFSDVKRVDVGYLQGVALKEDGTVETWGANWFGQLGDLSSLSNVKDVKAGYFQTIALKEDGTVWTWGDDNSNDDAQITPIQVPGLTNVVQIEACSGFGLALKSDGTLWKWEGRGTGVEGDGFTENTVPEVIKTDIAGMSCNFDSNGESQRILAWDNAGALWETSESGEFEKVQGISNVIIASGGFSHTLALTSDGAVWAWGSNHSGQIGDHSLFYSASPISILQDGQASGIVAGGSSSYICKDGAVWKATENGLEPFSPDTLGSVVKFAESKSGTYFALKSDGSVWGWGSNSSGQLGNGTAISSETPVQITGLTDVVDISVGSTSTFAVKSDGTVWAWGNTAYGIFDSQALMPTQIAALSGASKVAAGMEHVLVLKNDGTVVAWGRNWGGCLGDGTTDESNIPVSVNNLTNVIEIAAGNDFSMALKEDGTVWTWGRNYMGQLGNNDVYTKVPLQISLTNVSGISAGYEHALAVKEDGTIWAWGNNVYGQLGTGEAAPYYSYNEYLLGQLIPGSKTPVQVEGISTAVSVSAGNNHSLALLDDGSVCGWGYNYSGQLGKEFIKTYPAPYRVADDNINDPLPAIQPASISAGAWHNLMIDENGRIRAAGNNINGQLGSGNKEGTSEYVMVKDFTDAIAVGAGLQLSLALKADGTLWSWGNWTGRMLGTPLPHSDIPVQVKTADGSPLTNIVAISIKRDHWLALKSDGTVWAWGRGTEGQLGNGSSNNKYTNAVQVINADGTPLTDVAGIAAGVYHSMAVKNDGTVWCWGKNEYGQLGNQSTENSNVAVMAAGLENVEQVAAGEAHCLAKKSDGSVWAWGRNQYGQLGDNSRNSSNIPVQVKGGNGIGLLTGVDKIDAGSGFSIALMTDGRVMSWGHNYVYQLGDGTQASKNAPVYVQNEAGSGPLEQVAEISASVQIGMAKTEDGTVWVWGTNQRGEFGNGTIQTASSLPLRAFTGAQPGTPPLRITYDSSADGSWVVTVQNNLYTARNATVVMKMWNKQTLIMEELYTEQKAVPSAGTAASTHVFTVPDDRLNCQMEFMVLDDLESLNLLSNVIYH